MKLFTSKTELPKRIRSKRNWALKELRTNPYYRNHNERGNVKKNHPRISQKHKGEIEE